MISYHDMISKYDIEIWYHKMISYSIIIRWYHNILLCSRNQAWEAGNFQIGGFSPYETIFTWNFQNRGFPGEPGVGNLRTIPPVALISKNPYRQSLIGEKWFFMMLRLTSRPHQRVYSYAIKNSFWLVVILDTSWK